MAHDKSKEFALPRLSEKDRQKVAVMLAQDELQGESKKNRWKHFKKKIALLYKIKEEKFAT